jgi:RimJ/RimL family protein N-acetyltransferase
MEIDNRFQPTLENDLVLLRPLQQEDFDALYAVAADPLLWEQHPARNRYQLDVFKALFTDAMASKGALVIIDKRTNEVIGSSRIFRWNETDLSVEIGYSFIARRCWGGNYNASVKALMIAHIFTFAEKIYFVVGTENYRSQKAVLKLGAAKIEMPFASPTPSVAFVLTKGI